MNPAGQASDLNLTGLICCWLKAVRTARACQINLMEPRVEVYNMSISKPAFLAT